MMASIATTRNAAEPALAAAMIEFTLEGLGLGSKGVARICFGGPQVSPRP